MSDFYKKRIYPVIFIILATLVFTAPISLLYIFTKDQVKANETIVLKKAVLYTAGVPVPQNNQEIVDYYDKHVKTAGKGNNEYYIVTSADGSFAAYVIPVQGPGLWGRIRATLGFRKDLKTFTGIDFISQNETPGLGARITEKWFREQFRGKQQPVTLVPEKSNSVGNEINAITGASQTSGFVEKIVNNANPQQMVNEGQ